MEETEIETALAAVRSQIVRANLDEDPEDPRTGAKICALNCKLYSLLTMLAQLRGKAFDNLQAQHQDWEKRRTQAEAVRKNWMLPIILGKLEAWQTGASEIKDRTNGPVFNADDETGE